jgi:hypothetical protein
MLNPAISVLMSGCLFAVTAATPPSIGTIKSSGEFRVDGSTVRGNSTIFEGDVIETEAARSVVVLSGTEITLSRQSRMKVFGDRIVLEDGSGLVRDDGKHVIEAATLRIVPAPKDSVVQVETSGPTHVAVSAQSGSAEVRNSAGVLIASLRTGMALSFDPQAGAAAAANVTGILRVTGTTFLLTDTTANITVELRGTDLAKYAGKLVHITGSIVGSTVAASGASEVVHVTAIDVVSRGKKVPVAAAAGAGAGAGAGAAAAGTAGAAAAGISTAATVAIVAGVGVAGGVAGLAVTGSFSGGSSVSRQ